MAKIIVTIAVVAVMVWVARRLWLAFLAARTGAVPPGDEVPSVPLEPDRGWQVTRTIDGDWATVRLEHPRHGERAAWRVHLREPGAYHALERAMDRAGRELREHTSRLGNDPG